MSYKDKLKMVAYTKQASFGKYRPDVSPDVGFLDVVGSDRRYSLCLAAVHTSAKDMCTIFLWL